MTGDITKLYTRIIPCFVKIHDSCEYHLLLIVHEIYKSFDCNPSLYVRDTFRYFKKTLESMA